jgi:hypothetical protein
MPRALLRRLLDGTYRLERADPSGRRVAETYPSLIAALNAYPELRDRWRGVDRGDGIFERDVLYLVPDDVLSESG